MSKTVRSAWTLLAVFSAAIPAAAQGTSEDRISTTEYKRGNDWFSSNGNWSGVVTREGPLGYAGMSAVSHARVFGASNERRIAEARISADYKSDSNGGKVELFIGGAAVAGYPKYWQGSTEQSGTASVSNKVIINWTDLSLPAAVKLSGWKVQYRMLASADYSWTVHPMSDFVWVVVDLRFRPSAEVRVVPPLNPPAGQSLALEPGVLQFGEVRVWGQVGMTASSNYGNLYGQVQPTRFAVTVKKTVNGTVSSYVYTNQNFPNATVQQPIWSMWW